MLEKSCVITLLVFHAFVSICTSLVEGLHTEGTVAEVGVTVEHIEAMPTRFFIKFFIIITFTKKLVPAN